MVDVVRLECERLIKKEKIYRQLVSGERDICRHRIPVVKVVGRDDYKNVLAWKDYWDSISLCCPSIRVIYGNHSLGRLGGRNYVPSAYVIETAAAVFDYLGLTVKRLQFMDVYHCLTSEFPCLSDLCFKYRDRLLRDGSFVQKILALARYFRDGAVKDCYITQWVVPGIDTKFHLRNFEVVRLVANAVLDVSLENRDQFFAYFNLRDRNRDIYVGILGGSFFFNGTQRFTNTVQELSKWQTLPEIVFIFENKDIGSYVADEVRCSVPCVVFYGVGYAVSVLKDVPWLSGCKLYYYGDLDKDGFSMLSELRGVFPNLKSFLMDDVDAVVEDRHGFVSKERSVDNLTEAEYCCYKKVLTGNWFEQEHVDRDKLLACIRDLLLSD